MGLFSNLLSANMSSIWLAVVLYGGALLAVVILALQNRRLKQNIAKDAAPVDADQVQPSTPSLEFFGHLPRAERTADGKLPASKTPAHEQPQAPPRRKLFLSWAAVHRAVSSGAVPFEDLDICLFCTSIGELNLAEEFDQKWFERLHPALAKARREGRLICSENRTRLNDTETWEVNLLLQRNGVAKLSCADQSGTLDQIPMYACVPSVSDGSLEVLWAAHPLRGDWRRAWGRSLEEIDAAFADLPDEPEGPRANWMQELNQPIIDEARSKFEKPEEPHGDKAFYTPADCEADGQEQRGDDADDPADFWKKGGQDGDQAEK